VRLSAAATNHPPQQRRQGKGTWLKARKLEKATNALLTIAGKNGRVKLEASNRQKFSRKPTFWPHLRTIPAHAIPSRNYPRINLALTLKTKLELVNVGRLSFRSKTSTRSIRTVSLGGLPPSEAATPSR